VIGFVTATKCGELKRTREQEWIVNVYNRIGYSKALVAIANKRARQLWVPLAKAEAYKNADAWQSYERAA
jgi:transposase